MQALLCIHKNIKAFVKNIPILRAFEMFLIFFDNLSLDVLIN